jgi:hypothetical protein
VTQYCFPGLAGQNGELCARQRRLAFQLPARAVPRTFDSAAS